MERDSAWSAIQPGLKILARFVETWSLRNHILFQFLRENDDESEAVSVSTRDHGFLLIKARAFVPREKFTDMHDQTSFYMLRN